MVFAAKYRMASRWLKLLDATLMHSLMSFKASLFDRLRKHNCHILRIRRMICGLNDFELFECGQMRTVSQITRSSVTLFTNMESND